MNTLEQAPRYEDMPDFGMQFGMEDFDINAAFTEAINGVISDKELALDEKVRRMEVIVSEGMSEVYRNFVDFRQMAAQIQMMCNHDHTFNQSIKGSDTLSGLLDNHKKDDGHNHKDSKLDDHNHSDKEEDDDEIDPVTGKKKKKKKYKGWLF